MGEFDLIERYFKPPQGTGPGSPVALGIGDDCALLLPRTGTQLAISSDMLVEGRHFLPTVSPELLGHKALAVNLSDLAACGAKPLAFTLALALPEANADWLQGFSRGLFALADAHQCRLVGGDTTRGPLNICITVFGEVPVVDGQSQALLRSGARAGDEIWVSGTLGDARLALEVFRGHLSVDADTFRQARARMEQPTPRIELGLALRGIASAAIDISDGLLGDLSHILKASQVGASIQTELAVAMLGTSLAVTSQQALQWVLGGGDDYELAFTAPVARREAVHNAGQQSGTPVTRIGQITAAAGLLLLDGNGVALENTFSSFDHFQ